MSFTATTSMCILANEPYSVLIKPWICLWEKNISAELELLCNKMVFHWECHDTLASALNDKIIFIVVFSSFCWWVSVSWISILNRCAEKLYYKKRKEKEQLKLKEHEKHQRKRWASSRLYSMLHNVFKRDWIFKKIVTLGLIIFLFSGIGPRVMMIRSWSMVKAKRGEKV